MTAMSADESLTARLQRIAAAEEDQNLRILVRHLAGTLGTERSALVPDYRSAKEYVLWAFDRGYFNDSAHIHQCAADVTGRPQPLYARH